MSIPYVMPDDPRYGESVELRPWLRRVVARNPGKFSGPGSGTYIVGRGDVAVIDPGPILNSHKDALLAALEGETVTRILVTHCHSDHSPLAAWLSEQTGAPTVGHGPHVLNTEWVDDDTEPYVPDEDDLAAKAAMEADGGQMEESVDTAFAPDIVVRTGDVAASGDGWTLTAVHTPGHTSNHTAYWLPEHRALFTGDHIMGWSTTVITPPDGDMRDYFESLAKVQALDPATLWPTHGAVISDVQPFVAAFVQHRLDRERNILACVREGETSIRRIVERLYVGVNPKLYRAAARSVLAHMMKLIEDGLVRCDAAQPGVTTPYYPTSA